MRLPRIFGKKRGHRRTGSQAWASFGEGVFHALLVGAGLIIGTLLISGVAVPEWRINHDFIATRCRVLGRGLVKRVVEDPPGRYSTTWRPCVRVRYDTASGSRESWSRSSPAAGTADRSAAVDLLSAWNPGTEVPGWYDPSDHDVVVLERGYNWWMWLLALLLPGALLAFGGAGLARAIGRWGKSAEAIAAAGSSDLLVPLSHAPRTAPDHPGVPVWDDMINSPGTILRYRLPIESPENWTLLGMGLFALLWNAVLVVLAVGAGLDFMGGKIDWLLIGLLVPFVAVGGFGVAMFARGLLINTVIGTTQLEISDHPLRPGNAYDVLLAQGGTGVLRELELSLELEEQATFRQGTDTRSERLVTSRSLVKAWGDVQLSPGTRFEVRARFTIPAAAMHSFGSEHNAVRWQLVVRGAPARWPAFTRIFPVVVFPDDPPAGPAGGRSAGQEPKT